MSTQPTVSLSQTMELLDCVDVVRQTEPQASLTKEPAALSAHLQGVCQEMGQPLSVVDADKAVAIYLSEPAGPITSRSPILVDRPVNEKEWISRVRDLRSQLQAAEAWEEKITPVLTTMASCLLPVGVISFLTVGVEILMKLISFLVPGGPIDHWSSVKMGTTALVVGAVVCFILSDRRLFRPLVASKTRIRILQGELKNLRAVAVDSRPTQETLQKWARFPGVAAAFYQIHTSDVPFLEQDLLAFKQNNETCAKAERDRASEQAEIRSREEMKARDAAWRREFGKIAQPSSPAVAENA